MSKRITGLVSLPLPESGSASIRIPPVTLAADRCIGASLAVPRTAWWHYRRAKAWAHLLGDCVLQGRIPDRGSARRDAAV